MAVFPEMPAQLRGFFPDFFWNWWQAFRTFMTSNFTTTGDITLSEAGKGIHLISPDGTAYYVTVDNAGSLTVTAE